MDVFTARLRGQVPRVAADPMAPNHLKPQNYTLCNTMTIVSSGAALSYMRLDVSELEFG